MAFGSWQWKCQLERIGIPWPNQLGFDYSYIWQQPKTGFPPFTLKMEMLLDWTNDPIEVNYQKNFEGEPTGLENPELLTMKHHGHNSSIVNGIPRIGFMKGGDAAKWRILIWQIIF